MKKNFPVRARLDTHLHDSVLSNCKGFSSISYLFKGTDSDYRKAPIPVFQGQNSQYLQLQLSTVYYQVSTENPLRLESQSNPTVLSGLICCGPFGSLVSSSFLFAALLYIESAHYVLAVADEHAVADLAVQLCTWCSPDSSLSNWISLQTSPSALLTVN